MTRETKIGLLVGLAFIIVIGILLSDHLTSTNEPQQAQLAQVGGNVRSATNAPGVTTTGPQVTQVPPTNTVSPQQQVPTKEDITPRQPPVEIVQIGGAPTQPQQPQRPVDPPVTPEPPTQIAQGPANLPETLVGQQAGINQPRVPGSIAEVAERMGEELVPVGPQNNNTLGLTSTGKQYRAEPGDNLAKIALKTLGKASKANCDAIIAANPTLGQNPNLIVAGRSYNIPAAANAATPAPIATHDAPVSTSEHFYTVKAGDSLTKIAVIQLGSAGAVAAIKDLNKETLKGSDVIRPNMKLRLPAKPIAS